MPTAIEHLKAVGVAGSVNGDSEPRRSLFGRRLANRRPRCTCCQFSYSPFSTFIDGSGVDRKSIQLAKFRKAIEESKLLHAAIREKGVDTSAGSPVSPKDTEHSIPPSPDADGVSLSPASTNSPLPLSSSSSSSSSVTPCKSLKRKSSNASLSGSVEAAFTRPRKARRKVATSFERRHSPRLQRFGRSQHGSSTPAVFRDIAVVEQESTYVSSDGQNEPASNEPTFLAAVVENGAPQSLVSAETEQESTVSEDKPTSKSLSPRTCSYNFRSPRRYARLLPTYSSHSSSSAPSLRSLSDGFCKSPRLIENWYRIAEPTRPSGSWLALASQRLAAARQKRTFSNGRYAVRSARKFCQRQAVPSAALLSSGICSPAPSPSVSSNHSGRQPVPLRRRAQDEHEWWSRPGPASPPNLHAVVGRLGPVTELGELPLPCRMPGPGEEVVASALSASLNEHPFQQSWERTSWLARDAFHGEVAAAADASVETHCRKRPGRPLAKLWLRRFCSEVPEIYVVW